MTVKPDLCMEDDIAAVVEVLEQAGPGFAFLENRAHGIFLLFIEDEQGGGS